MILHTGKSRFNGENFAVVATGFDRDSKNVKTGPMVGLTIIATDESPVESNQGYIPGELHTVCGSCPLSFNRGCYVRVGFSIQQIWHAMKRGIYGNRDYSKFEGRSVRFGLFGSPSLIPLRIVKAIVKRAKNFTGYTHDWKYAWAQPYKKWFMASVDNVADKKICNDKGWKTFRIVNNESEILPDEIICPNQTHGVQCYTCGLCCGQTRPSKNIAVLAHGGNAVMSQIRKRLKNVNSNNGVE